MDDPLDGPPRSVCTSCGGMNNQRDRCGCVVDRATALASLAHELHRVTVRGWRRPRPWSGLPLRARQALVHAGIDLVEALEGHGWRLVSAQAPAAHVLREREPRTEPGPVVPRYMPVRVTWPDAPDWPDGPPEYELTERPGPEWVQLEDRSPELVRPYVARPDGDPGPPDPPMYRAPDAVQ